MTSTKNFLLLFVLFSTLSIGYSLQCCSCWSKGDEVCEPKIETCFDSSGFLGLFPREVACISGHYHFQGTNCTYSGCDDSRIAHAIFYDDESREEVISYAVCKEDLCNREEEKKLVNEQMEEKMTSNGNENVLINNFLVVVTGVLLTISALF